MWIRAFWWFSHISILGANISCLILKSILLPFYVFYIVELQCQIKWYVVIKCMLLLNINSKCTCLQLVLLTMASGSGLYFCVAIWIIVKLFWLVTREQLKKKFKICGWGHPVSLQKMTQSKYHIAGQSNPHLQSPYADGWGSRITMSLRKVGVSSEILFVRKKSIIKIACFWE